jgi:hypothetical protein
MADHFDDNPLIATLRRIYFAPDGDEGANAIWGAYAQEFAKMDDTNRRSDLLTIDAYLNENAAATRETAALFQQRRHLGDIDATLRKARR